MGKRLKNISGPMRVAIVVSAAWSFFWLLWGWTNELVALGIFFAFMPLIVGWGIWWIIKGYRSHK